MYYVYLVFRSTGNSTVVLKSDEIQSPWRDPTMMHLNVIFDFFSYVLMWLKHIGRKLSH